MNSALMKPTGLATITKDGQDPTDQGRYHFESLDL